MTAVPLPPPTPMCQLQCPHCGKQALLVGGDVIYPHRPDLFHLKFWRCAPCDAYVGCHKAGCYCADLEGNRLYSDGTVPLGRLANARLRRAKSKAHHFFDQLWSQAPNPKEARKKEYKWLAKQLGIKHPDCHIGLLDDGQCWQVVKICTQRLMVERLANHLHKV